MKKHNGSNRGKKCLNGCGFNARIKGLCNYCYRNLYKWRWNVK